jgi:hypothetical protein
MKADEDLRRALGELEAAAPSAAPSLESSNSQMAAPWVALTAVVAVAIVTGLLVSGLPRRDGVGQQSPTMVPSMSAPESAAPSAATIAPSASSSPAPTTWVTSAHDLPSGEVLDVAEARGVLYAMGANNDGQPAIWHSQDGERWTAADLPVVEERLPEQPDLELGAMVHSVMDVGDRLVALATVGYAYGPGIYGTKLYVSDDGSAWEEVTATPGVLPPSGRPMYDLAVVGSRVVAAGNGVWVSSDGGLSWTDAVDAATFDGVVHELEARGDLLVALGGSMAPYDDVGPGEAYAWVSRDEGTSWNRHPLDDGNPATGGAAARAVTIDESGTIMTITWSIGASSDPGSTAVEFVMWRSDDLGETWSVMPHPDVECCVLDIVATPTGWVIATYETADAGDASVLRSTDGSDWTVEDPGVNPRAIAWTPTFGLVALGDDSIAFFRELAP